MSSTPIHKIPVQTQPVSQETEDPEVLAILKEMEAQQPTPQVYTPPPPQPPFQMPAPRPTVVATPVPEEKPFIQTPLLQKAALAAIMAFVLFYPKTLPLVYEKLPSLEAFDPFLRTFLLAVVLYLIMWKFNI